MLASLDLGLSIEPDKGRNQNPMNEAIRDGAARNGFQNDTDRIDFD